MFKKNTANDSNPNSCVPHSYTKHFCFSLNIVIKANTFRRFLKGIWSHFLMDLNVFVFKICILPLCILRFYNDQVYGLIQAALGNWIKCFNNFVIQGILLPVIRGVATDFPQSLSCPLSPCPPFLANLIIFFLMASVLNYF